MHYSLFKRRGNPAWFVEWVERGERSERCLFTEHEDVAVQRAEALFAQPAPDHPAAREAASAPDYRVDHALEDLIALGCVDNAAGTIRCYRQRAGHLLRLLGFFPLASLRLDDVQSFISQRLAEGAAHESVRKELCVLRRSLDLARRRGVPGPDPQTTLPRFRAKYVPRKTWLTPQHFNSLLSELNVERALFVLVAVYTGARLSELQRLQWSDIDFSAQQVHIRGTKTQQSDRFVPLHPRLSQALQGRVRRGPLLEDWPNVRRDLAVACKRAGAPVVTPNDLRRTFASWLVQAGETSYVVAQLLGHSSSAMVERVYGRLAGHTLRTAISRLPSDLDD